MELSDPGAGQSFLPVDAAVTFILGLKRLVFKKVLCQGRVYQKNVLVRSVLTVLCRGVAVDRDAYVEV